MHCNTSPHGTLQQDSRAPKQHFRSLGGAGSTLGRRDAEFASRPVEAAQETFTFSSCGCLHATSNRGEPPSDSAEEALGHRWIVCWPCWTSGCMDLLLSDVGSVCR